MKIIGEDLLSRLKSKTILKRKPNLKLCSNHFKDTVSKAGRHFVGGQAVRDGNGWYKKK